MMRSLLCLSVLAFGLNAGAQDQNTNCEEVLERRDNTKISTFTNSTGGCYMSVMPFNVKNMTYRDYLFDEKGLMMIFVSYGDGPDSEMTGAREYYLFPRVQSIPHSFWQADNRLLVRHPSGTEFVFESNTGDLGSMSPGQVEVDPFFDPSRKAGIEIKKFEGILLDVGFTMGRSPSSQSGRSSQFKDSSGNTCTVKNTEVFKYTRGGDSSFKFLDDKSLQSFLKSRCPRILWPTK